MRPWWAAGAGVAALVVGGILLASPPGAPQHCAVRWTANHQPLPDPKCTPGAVADTDTAVVCARGYLASRPRPNLATARRKIAAAYEVTEPFQLDHLIARELGGSDEPANLWAQPGRSPNAKDRVENRLRRLVCSGAMTLAAAQREMAVDWTTAGSSPVRGTP
jgi:hypothetical protein